jgi:hypothetical protein
VAGARRPYEALNRQGAVRKRKGDVYEMNGHQFVQKQFYQPVMCALCQEFLLTGEGYSCEDCRYTCHKKCYPKVVTKCISKSNADGVCQTTQYSCQEVNEADIGRKTRTRSTTVFRTALLGIQTCRPTGVATVVYCCHLAARTRSNVRVGRGLRSGQMSSRH